MEREGACSPPVNDRRDDAAPKQEGSRDKEDTSQTCERHLRIPPFPGGVRPGEPRVHWRPNGLEMSRPASQGQYRGKAKPPAGRAGSIELLGGPETAFGLWEVVYVRQVLPAAGGLLVGLEVRKGDDGNLDIAR